MLREYWRLGRPVNALAGCIAVLLSGYAADPESWGPVLAAAATVLLITVSSNAWNDYRDLEIDRINKPARPLPAGTISPGGAVKFAVGATLLSLAAAATINRPALLIATGSNLLLYLYSWRLKCSILLGNAIVASIIALCFIFGGFAAGNVQPTVMPAATVFFAIAGREILKTMADYKGDREHNCRTVAVAWGNDVARIFVIIFLSISALLMLLTYGTEQYHLAYFYVVVLGMYPLFGYVAVSAKADSPPERLENNSTLLKYGFFIWFLAIALGVGLRA